MMLKNNILIDYALESDASEISNLEKSCFSEPWSEKQIEEEINNPDSLFLTAKTDLSVIGYLSGKMILDEFYISNIAVNMDFRNKHVATELINEAVNILKEKKFALLTLEVRESNSAARYLYEKLGFINLGIRKDFYSYPKENACIYTLFLNET